MGSRKVGWRAWRIDVIPILRQLLWPTRTLVLFGHSWHMIENTKADMSAHAPRRLKQKTIVTTTQQANCFRRKSSIHHDCSGVFKVMASQVRPGLTQPTRRQGTSKVRLIDQASTSKFHQGPRLKPHTEAGCMAAISPCDSKLKESAWQNGASMYVAGHRGYPSRPGMTIFKHHAGSRNRPKYIAAVRPADPAPTTMAT